MKGGPDSYPPGKRTESSLRIHSLPKTEALLRPIVLCITRITLLQTVQTYDIPLAGQNDSHVQDSRHLRELMRHAVGSGEVLLGYGISSVRMVISCQLHPQHFCHLNPQCFSSIPPSQVLNLSSLEADHKRESRSPSFWGIAKTSGVSQNTWPQSSLHLYMDSPLNVNQVKDTVPAGKQPNVVYHIPCSCAWSGLHWRLEVRMKEYWDSCEKVMMEKLALVEHVWENYYAIN